jgi:uncharacterized protein GlcG (DUF336 family)
MKRIRWTAWLSIALASLAMASPIARSQELLVQKALPLDMAEAIARGALESCRAQGYRIAVYVVDGTGDMKAFLRDDGVTALQAEIARRKAITAFAYRRPSSETAKAWATNKPLVTAEGALPAAGGVPIKAGEQTIGAIGIVGAPGGEKDEACASAGVAKVADKLK